MSESVGTFDKIWISADDSTYVGLEFLSGSTLGLSENLLDPNGIRGVRGHQYERVRRGTRQTGGTLLFNPTPADLDILLPWILGAAESSDTFALAETVSARYIKASRDGTVHKYDGLKVNAATFSASEGSLLQLAVEVVGVDEASASAPAVAIVDDAPYVMMDGTATIAGDTVAFRSIEVGIQNQLETRYNNSATPSSVHAVDRLVTVGLQLPFGDQSSLYGSSSAFPGAQVVATFTNSTKSLSFTMVKVQVPRTPNELGNRAARNLNWRGVARRSGTTQELVVTNDST